MVFYQLESLSQEHFMICVLTDLPILLQLCIIQTYAASYSGLAKLNRLQFIAEHCPLLRVEALKLAIGYNFLTNIVKSLFCLI